jgi:hypothetical protein
MATSKRTTKAKKSGKREPASITQDVRVIESSELDTYVERIVQTATTLCQMSAGENPADPAPVFTSATRFEHNPKRMVSYACVSVGVGRSVQSEMETPTEAARDLLIKVIARCRELRGLLDGALREQESLETPPAPVKLDEVVEGAEAEGP